MLREGSLARRTASRGSDVRMAEYPAGSSMSRATRPKSYNSASVVKHLCRTLRGTLRDLVARVTIQHALRDGGAYAQIRPVQPVQGARTGSTRGTHKLLKPAALGWLLYRRPYLIAEQETCVFIMRTAGNRQTSQNLRL